ncbi:MAG: hypothetical protein K0S00_4343 [Xanthobacteraceae bacterium]|jgi:hypothetical protein|nr:hypothetical protein [Xanthobacteraceae bacterium]
MDALSSVKRNSLNDFFDNTLATRLNDKKTGAIIIIIQRLLAERPEARGLAVAGMPLGSPGMESPGSEPETYEVVLFTAGNQQVFARYRDIRGIS